MLEIMICQTTPLVPQIAGTSMYIEFQQLVHMEHYV